MEDSLGFTSAFLEKPSRVDPKIYKSVVNKVRIFYRRSSPYGCAQNVKAEVKDIDKAVEANRLKEQRVDEYVEAEMKKLNLYKAMQNRHKRNMSLTVELLNSPRKNTAKPALIRPETDKKRKLIVNSAMNPRRSMALPAKPATADMKIKRRFSDPGNAGINLKRAASITSQVSDPDKSFSITKLKRLESLNAIMKSCDELKPKIKPNIASIENSQLELKYGTSQINEYIANVEDYIRLANDEKSIKEMMEGLEKPRRISKKAKLDDNMKNDMLAVTRKLIQLGGSKIWRHNHTEFMASAEKIINSIPKVRK